MICKPNVQQTVKIAKQTKTCRQSQMQVVIVHIKLTHPIVLIPRQAELICQIIFFPSITKKQTKGQLRQSQPEYTMNLETFSWV